MNIKTIKKRIEVKLTEWLDTITDVSLRNDLKKNVLVSGGSITSLFLKEEVNDYDVYIKDIDVLKRLARYYITPYLDKIELLDGRVKDTYTVEKYNDEESKSKYAVALRNLKKDQIKLYVAETAGLKIEPKEGLTYTPVFFSPNSISLTDKLQIVLRFHGDNEQIHKTFDFVHATNYFTFEDGLVTNKEALESILTKNLRYQGSLYPLTSILRMKKFIKRGWNINAGEVLKIMFQISSLDLTNPDILEEQLIGVDVAYFDKLIDILRGVEKQKIVSEYLNAIIDRVFSEADESEV